MAFEIEDNVPLPPGSGRGTARSEETEAIISLSEDGQSFFVPCTGDARVRLQKQLGSRGAGLRASGAIDFYLITRRVSELRKVWDEEIGDYEVDEATGELKKEMTDGLRVWRRATSIEEV